MSNSRLFVLAVSIIILLPWVYALPFWFFWTVLRVGERFFYFLPEVFHSINLIDCYSLCVITSIIQAILFPKNTDATTTT